MPKTIREIHHLLENCSAVIHEFSWLLDCYILDYFVDSHWFKLPKAWQHTFKDIDLVELGDILSGGTPKFILPLSFLSLSIAVKNLTLPRIPVNILNTADVHTSEKSQESKRSNCYSHTRMRNLFLKHVKAKKRHEITRMCQIVNLTSSEFDCQAAMDVGSGVGHLLRSLAYQYDMYTAGIERDPQLTNEARNLDLEFEYTASKHLSESAMRSLKRPIHINYSINTNSDFSQLMQSENFINYGVIGLHPCGDLGPFLIRHFAQSDNVKFICVVGCCYMKLTCEGKQCGYPMSNFLSENLCPLSYQSREIACHATEAYYDRLKSGNCHDLQVHAYRAALEVILLEINKDLKHTGIRSIKHTNMLSFQRYCELALERLGLETPLDLVQSERSMLNLSQWKQVVIFYTLRLMLAPVVETVILLDRILFLLEQGFQCDIEPIFDPRLSPRNHIIVGKKIPIK